jgi:hypothetical protein
MKLFSTISPTSRIYIQTASGIRGLSYNFSAKEHEITAELYIDRGKDAEEENLNIFHQLFEKKDQIEVEFGGPLQWEELPGRRACRISTPIPVVWTEGEEQWQKTFELMIDTMTRLENAFKPYINNL